MYRQTRFYRVFIFAFIFLLLNNFSCTPRKNKAELCDLIDLSIANEDYLNIIQYSNELQIKHPKCLVYSLEKYCAYYNLNSEKYDSLLIYEINNSTDSIQYTFESTFVKSLTYSRSEKYKKAIEELDEILAVEKFITILALKGHFYYLDNQFKKSIEIYDEILTRDLPLVFATNIYYLRIYSKYQLNDITGAIWDCAVMEDYGLIPDEDLLVKVANDSLKLDDLNLLNYKSINAKGVIGNFR